MHESILGFTQGPAYAAGMEDRLGKLDEGYLADLIVLDRDIYQVEPEEILELKVLGNDGWRRVALPRFRLDGFTRESDLDELRRAEDHVEGPAIDDDASVLAEVNVGRDIVVLIADIAFQRAEMDLLVAQFAKCACRRLR